MKFTVVGAGAMGLRYGVLLQDAGNEVDFVDGWEPNVEKKCVNKVAFMYHVTTKTSTSLT